MVVQPLRDVLLAVLMLLETEERGLVRGEVLFDVAPVIV